MEKEVERGSRTSMTEPLSYVSDHGTDLCVICRSDTGIPSNTPIDHRENYIEGSGQCCAVCAARIKSGEF